MKGIFEKLSEKLVHRNGILKRAAAIFMWGVLGSLVIILGYQYRERRELQQGIADKVLRFHVLANSNSAQDQELKLAVRDAVGQKISELLKGAENRTTCEAVILEAEEEIRACAKAVMEEAGYSYDVAVLVADVDFPAKAYADYVFPAGEYRAIQVVIGAGEGNNWWCVMYPNMCFSGSVYEVVEEEAKQALQEVLTEEEYKKVIVSGDYEIRWKYLTFLNEFM
jgi:stage II sporulation protein R